MYRNVIIFVCMTISAIATTVYSQENTEHSQTNSENNQSNTITGTVTKNDFAGDTISIITDDQRQMSFSVPSNSIITRDTKNVALMDIKNGHPVTIQYEVTSPGMNVVESINDNKPTSSGDVN